ncbi:MAG: chorismate mutase [Peptococcia bacterium]
MRLYGIRGATTTTENTATAILQETEKLMLELIKENNLTEDKVVSIIFTTTPDLTAEFPSKACRNLGWNQVALLGSVEADVPHGIPYCIRVLIQAYLDSPENLQHIYLNEAVRLRPDRAGR